MQLRAIARLADSVRKPLEGLIAGRSRDTPFSIITCISNPSVLRNGKVRVPLKDSCQLALSDKDAVELDGNSTERVEEQVCPKAVGCCSMNDETANIEPTGCEDSH